MKMMNLAKMTMLVSLSLSSAYVLAANDINSPEDNNNALAQTAAADTRNDNTAGTMNSTNNVSDTSTNNQQNAASDTTADNQQQNVDDDTLTNRVKSKLSGAAGMSQNNIDVSADNGKVKLSGSVNSEQEAANAVMQVASVPGVKDVDTTKFKIKNKEFTGDNPTKAKVHGVLMQQNLKGVRASVKNDVVTLNGNVNNQAQIDHVVDMIKNMDGVSDVKSNVKASGHGSMSHGSRAMSNQPSSRDSGMQDNTTTTTTTTRNSNAND